MHKLYIVSTPIGNMGDITKRAIETLEKVDVILAEDSRVTKGLLKKLGVDNKVISLHKWNEKEKADSIYEILEKGEAALVSDAGTPTISDPGQFLTNELHKRNVEIVSVPGASALIAALSISGMKYKTFSFYGFAPKKENQLIKFINESNEDLIVFYESPNRINKTLSALCSYDEKMEVAIVREITKKFESVEKGEVQFLKDKEYKGEIVLLIKNIKNENNDLSIRVNKLKELGMKNKEIIEYLTTVDSFKKNEIYEELKNE